MDRFDDMRARVSGSGGNSGGGGSGGGGPFGIDVLVQASDNFSNGDAFVGTLVSGVKPTIKRVPSGHVGTGSAMSADGSVFYVSGRLSPTSTSALFHVRKDGAYVDLLVDLPDLTGIGTTDYYTLNEDGTKFLCGMGTSILIIDIDKENITASAQRFFASDIDTSEASYAGYPFQVNGFYGVPRARGKYIFCAISAKYTSGTSSYNGYATAYFEITNAGLKNISILNTNSSSSYVGALRISEIIEYGEKDLIFFETNNYMHRVEILDGKVVSNNMINQKLTYITANGKYLINQKTLYRINQETGTCTSIGSFNQAIGAIDETGQYVYYNYGFYRASDTSLSTKLGTAYTPLNYFKIVGESYLDEQSQFATLVPSSDAEYIIAHTRSVSVAGDIYGVIKESMQLGETKYALKIFNK